MLDQKACEYGVWRAREVDLDAGALIGIRDREGGTKARVPYVGVLDLVDLIPLAHAREHVDPALANRQPWHVGDVARYADRHRAEPEVFAGLILLDQPGKQFIGEQAGDEGDQ